MKVYCINLESRVDRKERMIHVFNKYEELKEYEFVKAIDTSNDLVLSLHDQFSHLDKAYIACSESHFKVWNMIASLDVEYALVLEDDVYFHKDWERILHECLKSMPSDWELFRLDCYYLVEWDFCSDGNCGGEGLRKATDCTFADAYLITPKACRWLLEKKKEFLENEEWMNNETLLMELQEKGNTYTYFPHLALQHFDESDIQQKCTINTINAFYNDVYFKHISTNVYEHIE